MTASAQPAGGAHSRATSPASARSMKVEALTCSIGAEVSNVNLGAASRDQGQMAEIRSLLLKHKVLFFRDQDFSRGEHIAFARHFGDLEDHPVAGSDPDNPGLVRTISQCYKILTEQRRDCICFWLRQYYFFRFYWYAVR